MTPQQIFDKVCIHLFTQGERSIKDEKCLYRGPKGRSCAVGCLISDKDYRADMDEEDGGMTARRLVKVYTHLPIWFIENSELLSWLQSEHDENRTWVSSDTLRWHLKRVGQRHNLDVEVLNSEECKQLGKGN